MQAPGEDLLFALAGQFQQMYIASQREASASRAALGNTMVYSDARF